jgi:RNA polymerase sigma-70 factor, ECF subfamily
VVLLKEAPEPTDAGLVDDCLRGNAAAFDELVRRYKDRVYNVVYRYVGNHEDALDLSQEVFIRAYRGLKKYRRQATWYTWLFSIAANVARNRVRDSHRKGRDKGMSLEKLHDEAPALAQTAAASAQTPRSLAEQRELEGLLQNCLNELPDHYRLPFVLRTMDGLSYDEIAEVMECPVGTIKSRLNQARHLLHERLAALHVV